MGFLDDAKKQLTKAVDEHGDKIRDGLDKAGDVADKKTKGKYTDQIAKGKTAVDVLRACFPAGTLSGAPKIRAMEIIEELEPCRRGLYGGAVGYLSFTCNLDFAIAIRTLVTKGENVYLQAGAGIVADSDPDAEYDESVNKARAVVRALQMAKGAR